MKKLIILPLLSAFFLSCGNKKKDAAADEPISPPPGAVALMAVPVHQSPAPARSTARSTARTRVPTPAPAVVDANPTAAFRIPKADTKLPTTAQLKEGDEAGIQKVTVPSTQPSTTVKPPSPAPAE